MEGKVYLDYTQEELDNNFEQTIWAPNFEALRAANKARCLALRERMAHRVVSWGPSPEETLELLPCARPKAPVHFFIHGGRWLPQPDNNFIHYADTIVEAGAHFVGLRFATLDPQKPELRLPEVIARLRRAVIWLHRNAASFGGDPDALHLLGHSSGAHLASVLLTTDWKAEGAPETILKSGACISGMYDLRPVMLSARSAYVKLSAAEEDALSAIRHIGRIRCPILVAYGDRESPEFQRQGRSFGTALTGAGEPSDLMVLAGMNHFEGVASLQQKDSPLSRAVLAQMGVA